MPDSELHDAVAVRLRPVGQRYTTGRRRLVERLVDLGRPVTMTELLDDGDRMPQSSAYRNLVVLEQAGVVRRVLGAGGSARYELAEDLTEHHHHLICSVCGAVEDFMPPANLERALDRVVDQVADAAGFMPAGHRLDLLGTCADCS